MAAKCATTFSVRGLARLKGTEATTKKRGKSTKKASSGSVPSTPVSPAMTPSEDNIVPGVSHALFVEFVLATGKMDIPEALAHAQQTSKFQQNISLMDWLMRPGTNIWRQREEMLK